MDEVARLLHLAISHKSVHSRMMVCACPIAILQGAPYFTTSVKCKFAFEELPCQPQYSLRIKNHSAWTGRDIAVDCFYFSAQNVQYFSHNECLARVET